MGLVKLNKEYTCQVTFGIEGKYIINRLAKFNSKDDAFIFVDVMDTIHRNVLEELEGVSCDPEAYAKMLDAMRQYRPSDLPGHIYLD